MATSLQGRALMRQFRQLVTRRQRILSRCGELEVHQAQEGLTIRPRVLELSPELADQAGFGPGEH